MNFASDNGAGVAPEILEAIAASSRVNAPAYGEDDYTARAEAMLSEIFETQVAAFLVATGTAANALALSAIGSALGAPYSATRRRMFTTTNAARPNSSAEGRNWSASPAGAARSRLTSCARRSTGFRVGSSSPFQPGALSLSQATEAGTVYWRGEVGELCDIAHSAGVGVHMDGARFGNALVACRFRPPT